jgi:hypothetical protein
MVEGPGISGAHGEKHRYLLWLSGYMGKKDKKGSTQNSKFQILWLTHWVFVFSTSLLQLWLMLNVGHCNTLEDTYTSLLPWF